MRRILGWYNTTRDSILYEGVSILLWRILVKLVSPVAELHHQILYEFDLTQPIKQRSARVDCHLQQMTEADIEVLVDQRLGRPPPDDVQLSNENEYRRARLERERARLRDTYRRWFRAGELCFVARIDKELGHSNWIRFYETGPVSSRPVTLGPGEAYCIEGFTPVHWRGKRLHEAVHTYMLRYAQSHGYRLELTITDLTKVGSRRGLARVGGWRRRGHHLLIAPRGLGRSWMVRLDGDVSPIARGPQGEPIRS